MTPTPSAEASTLASRYREAARAMAAARADGNPEAGNKHYDNCVAIYRQLKRLGPEAVGALLPLLDLAEPDVALKAAGVLLEFFPNQAAAALRQLSTVTGLTGLTARMTLREWDAGRMEFPEI